MSMKTAIMVPQSESLALPRDSSVFCPVEVHNKLRRLSATSEVLCSSPGGTVPPIRCPATSLIESRDDHSGGNSGRTRYDPDRYFVPLNLANENEGKGNHGNAVSGEVSLRNFQREDTLSPRSACYHSRSDTLPRSPRRTPSPYSCGTALSFREPGNISSQNFQINWDIANTPIDLTPRRQILSKCPTSLIHGQSPHTIYQPIARSGLDKAVDSTVSDEVIKFINSGNDDKVDDIIKSVSEHRKVEETPHPHPIIAVVEEDADDKSATTSSTTPPPPTQDDNPPKPQTSKSDENKKQSNNDESKPVTSSKNTNLVRISYLFPGGDEMKRVVDIKTVSELMEIYTSLKDPVILPFETQQHFYDQWARIPATDPAARPLLRPTTNLSVKCIALVQAIHNDQVRQSSTQTGNANSLVIPNPADVTCPSLDSIIEHYKQLSSHNPVFKSRNKTHPVTPFVGLRAKANSAQPIASRAGSGTSTADGTRSQKATTDSGGDDNSQCTTTGKRSPSFAKKRNAGSLINSKSKSISSSQHDESNSADPRKRSELESSHVLERQVSAPSPKFTYVNAVRPHTVQHYSHPSSHALPDGSHRDSSWRMMPWSKGQSMFSEDVRESVLKEVTTDDDHRCLSGHTLVSVEEEEDMSPDSNNHRGGKSPVRIVVEDDDHGRWGGVGGDSSGRVVAVEKRKMTSDINETNASSHNNHCPDSGDVNNTNNNYSNNNYSNNNNIKNNNNNNNNNSSSNSSNINLTSSMGRKLKSKFYSIQTPPHFLPKPEYRDGIFKSPSLFAHQHRLKQNALVNEIASERLRDLSRHSRQTSGRTCPRRRGSSGSSTKSHTSAPDLPTRAYSMCDRLEPPDAHKGDPTLAPPDLARIRSDRASAVSLASVHFLDLTDLRTMLRRTNTPIPRL